MCWLFDNVEKILGKCVNKNRVSYHTVKASIYNPLCKRRDLLVQKSDCDIIINWDDDDIYLYSCVDNIVKFFINNRYSCLLHSNVWRYNLNSQEYLRCINYSGGSQWAFRSSIFNNNDIKFCFGFCQNEHLSWPYRHTSGACAELCFYDKVLLHKIKTNNKIDICDNQDSIRLSHHDNIRRDNSWRNDKNNFGFAQDQNYEWLFGYIPDCLKQYYKNEILSKI
jgi:hypothetical protein